MSKTFLFTLLLILPCALFISLNIYFRIRKADSAVLGELNVTEEVEVFGYVRMEKIDFIVHPERRIPRAGNWDTFADVTLIGCNVNTNYDFADIPTNTMGLGSISIPDNQVIESGQYRFFVRGYSHLRRRFNCYSLSKVEELVDLTVEGKELYAGEVSNIYDNYINSLDLSVLLNKLFSDNYKNDLNQDTEVNSLDLSNQVNNIFLAGD